MSKFWQRNKDARKINMVALYKEKTVKLGRILPTHFFYQTLAFVTQANAQKWARK